MNAAEDGKVGAGDTARAETELPLSAQEVTALLADSQLLFRLNPHIEIEHWESVPQGHLLATVNELNGLRLKTTIRVERSEKGVSFSYASGLKQRTEFVVVPTAGGVRLVVTDHYPRIESEEDPRVAEVDRSLVSWVAAIRKFLLAHRRWAWLPLLFPMWRWWNERFMPEMAPRSRRIVRLIVWISLLEFAVFLGMVLVLRYAA